MPETWTEGYGWNARQNYERGQVAERAAAEQYGRDLERRREREEEKRRRQKERDELLSSLSPAERQAFLHKEEVAKTQKFVWVVVGVVVVAFGLMIFLGNGLQTNVHKGAVQVAGGCVCGALGLLTLVYAAACADAGKVHELRCCWCVCPAVVAVFGICLLGGCVVEHPDVFSVMIAGGADGTWTPGRGAGAVHSAQKWGSAVDVQRLMWQTFVTGGQAVVPAREVEIVHI